jgi:hypothetical protein
MNNHLRLVQGDGTLPPDDDAIIARELQGMLAHPNGSTGHAALEKRIMASVAGETDIFSMLPRWMRPALAAAAAASLIIAGAAEWRARQQDQHVSVMTLVGAPRQAALDNTSGTVAREATLRSLLEP